MLGQTVRKKFYVTGEGGETRYYKGKIISHRLASTVRGKQTDTVVFRVRYHDGDEEDLSIEEINELRELAEKKSNKDQICADLAERAHCWYFTHKNTSNDLIYVKHALTQVRYGAYYNNTSESQIQGFVYSAGVVSKNKMLGVLEHANWKAICGQLHHSAVYSEMKSKDLLVELGHPPAKKPTLLEYNTALKTLEGPWWV
jgi:hypothetical protein